MANTTSNRTQIIAGSLNEAVYGAGLPIFGVPSGWGKKDSTVLVPPGKFVFYNPDTELSTGEAATRSTVKNLMIGVGVAGKDPAISVDIAWLSDGFSGCAQRNLTGKSSACGLPDIVDIMWGDCVQCNQTYTIEVEVYSPYTESFGELGKFIYHFTYHYPCGDCPTGDCVDPTPNPDEIMCGLYNKIKGIENDPNWDITLNNIPIGGDHEFLFDVSKLYDGTAPSDDTTHEYCISGSDSTCEDCDNFTAIGGYDLGEGEGAVVFSPATFTGTVSKRAHIDSAISQLNAALAGNGSAVYLPAVGNCCTNNKIEVNSCFLNFDLKDHVGASIAPCDESNPFTGQTVYSECQDCDSANSTNTFTVGLRFYSRAVEGECDCIPGNKALVEYFSEIRVYFKRGWENSKVRTLQRQYATLPKGQGFQWQAREIAAMQDGFREPFHDELRVGKYGLPGLTDRLNQVMTNCKERYCVIGGTYEGKTRHDNTGETNHMPLDWYILIPDDHSTAKTSVLNALNTYFTGAECGLPTVTCGSWS